MSGTGAQSRAPLSSVAKRAASDDARGCSLPQRLPSTAAPFHRGFFYEAVFASLAEIVCIDGALPAD